jgi:SAM-dependent methyltransferase
LTAAERRYAADLRVQEIARALRALSSAYVERRERSGRGQRVRGALDSPGKRAAFALYYAPLHFIAVTEAVHALRATGSRAGSIVDLGCGTGAAGAAWALAARPTPKLIAIDRHPWAVAEARWTMSHFGLTGRAQQGDVERLRGFRPGDRVIAAYTLNELSDDARARVVHQLCEHARNGGHVLVLEPLSGGVVPWWPDLMRQMTALGGRADEWKLAIDAPPLVRQLGTAAGLDYRELRFQTLLV